MPNKKVVLVSLFLIISFAGPESSSAQTSEVRDITFPVEGPSSFRNDFGDPRSGGTREHLGVDVIADKMTPVVSVVNGTVVYAPTSQPSWGYTISIQDSDGYTYRYLHLNNDNIGTDDGKGGSANAYAPGIRRGVKVKKISEADLIRVRRLVTGALSDPRKRLAPEPAPPSAKRR